MVSTLRFFLQGDRFVLGDDSRGIYLFERGQLDQPLEEWPNTIDGRMAAKARIRELDQNIVALFSSVAVEVIPPKAQAAPNIEDVVVAEVISNRHDSYTTPLGCPRCSTLYWVRGNEWREICTNCGSATLFDADLLLAQREAALETKLTASFKSLAGKWRAEARGRRLVAKETPKALFGGIAAGPLYLYLEEQYHATFRYGRRLTHDEAYQRIEALCQQQAAAAEAQRRSQYELAAVVGFLSISNRLGNIERNQ